MRRMVSLALAAAVLLCLLGASAAAGPESGYRDVPANHWAAGDISKAARYGLMQGVGGGRFGLGDRVDRASFVTVLCRMFGWELTSPSTASFSDCKVGEWYYAAVETAVVQGVVKPGGSFRPRQAITRGEMAVMLVKALGYEKLAQAATGMESPFSDGTGPDNGYYTLAYDIGMTNGVAGKDGTLAFLPNDTASREEAAAMLVRVHERYIASLDWLHGFYAFSSYGQIDLTDRMDAVSLGWARLALDEEGNPWLNTTTAGGNEWAVPQGASVALDHFRQKNTPYHLNVYASVWDEVTLANGITTNAAARILSMPETRAQGVAAIVAAAEEYDGITLDVEGLRNWLKEPYVAFVTALREALPRDKKLYVCVMPDNWYDGYDFRALGELCDKVILMAHDYEWASIPGYYLGTTKTDCPVTPFAEVYRALRAVTDPETGVQDRSKLAIALSFSSTGFLVDEQNRLLSQTFYHPSTATIITRLRQKDTQRYYSEEYRNPYLYYRTEDGSRYRLWYEDARSVTDKIRLAGMFGITGVSIWRLGIIPDYEDEGLYYDVWDSILTLGQTK